MKTISKEKIVEVLKELSTKTPSVEVEITTFDFETIKGLVTRFKTGEYNEDIVHVEDNEGVTNEVEIDFIRDLSVDE